MYAFYKMTHNSNSHLSHKGDKNFISKIFFAYLTCTGLDRGSQLSNQISDKSTIKK